MRKTGDSIPEERIARNLATVRARMGEAAAKAARDPGSVTLVGVTKYATNDETAALIRLGVVDLGESRVQDSERKIEALPAGSLRWHLIGHLQTNKAGKAVSLFHTIHSIDSPRVALELDKEARKIAAQRTSPEFSIRGLIEINAAREESKYGLSPEKEALVELLKKCGELRHLRIVGLMAMAPYAENPEPVSRPVFKRMRELLEEANASKVYPLPLTELSMGMTQDYEIAIAEGATMVRIGSALFE